MPNRSGLSFGRKELSRPPMAENPNPRQMVTALLQGVPPRRALRVPIVFSVGARVENISRKEFLANATKISNSLRQIRGHLRTDGVTCYFDSYLELEVLGATLHWPADDQPPTIAWPRVAQNGMLPEGLRSPEEAVKTGRVKVAVEVIRRLKSLLRDEPLLMAVVTGPFTLAARLSQLNLNSVLRSEDVPDAALEMAASMTTQVSAALVDAGADLIFVREEILPAFSAESFEVWASSLAPTFNIIRFYGALPVFHLAGVASFAQNSAAIFRQTWDCILCPPLDASLAQPAGNTPSSNALGLGLALPDKFFQPDSFISRGNQGSAIGNVSKPQVSLLTTVGDVPADTNLERMMEIFENASRPFSW